MTDPRPTVRYVATADIPEPLPEAIVRSRHHVQAVRAQSLLETGTGGRTALAWEWALTGTRPSPVTLSLAPGRPPSRDQILAEAAAPPEGSTAPPGVPADYGDQLAETRRVLSWLVGATDEIPADSEERGRLIGARDDYARTDHDIRQARDHALRGIHTPTEATDPAAPGGPGRRDASQANAAWLRGVRDQLDWILGDRPDSPLCHRAVGLPTIYDLTYEESAARDIAAQGLRGAIPADGAIHPPPQYGEAIQATIHWLRGETTVPPVDQEGRGVYAAASETHLDE
jgi:hypothetical protein